MLVDARFGGVSREAGFIEGTLGFVDLADGHYIDAERHYGNAARLSLQCSFPDDGFTGTMIETHAATLDSISRFEDSLNEHNRALTWALAHSAADSPTLTSAMGGLATGLHRANRLTEAAEIEREVIDRQRRYEPTNVWYRASQLSNYGATLILQGHSDEAEAMWAQARQFYAQSKTHRDPWLMAQATVLPAQAARAQGRFDDAVRLYEAAATQLSADLPADNVRLAGVHVEQGMALALAGRAAEGERIATPALVILRAKLKPDDVRLLIPEMLAARIAAILHGAVEGDRLIVAPAAGLEARLLDGSTSRTDLIRYAPTFAAGFAAQAGLAFAAGRNDAAFHALQLANFSEIALVSADVAARAAAANPATAELARALQDHVRLRQGLDKERSAAVSGGKSAEIARLEAAIQANDAQIVREGAEIDRLVPAFRKIARPEPISLAAFQARLTLGQVLLAPLPLDNGTLAVAVTRDAVVWAKTATNAFAVRALVRRIRSSIDAALTSDVQAPPFDLAASRALFAAIAPPPIAKLLRAHRDILMYDSGALATIPPAVLVTAPDSGGGLARARWLVRDHTLTVLPTLPQAAEARSEAPVRLARFLGVGAPDLAPPPLRTASNAFVLRGAGVALADLRELPALPRAADELHAIATALAGSQDRVLTGDDATEARLRALPLDSFSVIAFATHGLVSGDFPGLQEPGLVMTPGSLRGAADADPAGDGILSASEVAALRLDADWVILSACDTANGGADAPTYSGLTSAFLAAGARALLVSHWRVRDDAAQRLTVDTVRGAAAGQTRAMALQKAMLRLMADRSIRGGQHPAVWAPFVLVQR